ncbi:MAG: endonuclease/exonuclease/phosphatase family protein [Candidatus Thorarchaeota archaeon]
MTSFDNFYKKINSELALLTVMFLFFFQLVGDLIESIYMLNLLNQELNEKALGVLFLITPIILLGIKHKIPNYLLEATVIITIVSRLISPFFNTENRIISSGLGVGCFMLFLPIYFSEHIKIQSRDDGANTSLKIGAGLALAILLLITFRTLNSTVDISTYQIFQEIGWVIGIIGILSLIGRLKVSRIEKPMETQDEGNLQTTIEEGFSRWTILKGVKLLSLGLVSILTLNYFVFSNPTVISRWTEADYIAITITIALMITISIFILTLKPEVLGKLNPRILWVWNGLFVFSLFLTIFVHTFPFPANPSSDPVIINHPLDWYYYLPLAMLIILSPIIFIDITLLSRELIRKRPNPSKLGGGFGVASLFFILMSFILIFTNVWGYIDPISPIFRNLFWLPILLVGLTIPVMGKVLFKKRSLEFKPIINTLLKKKLIASFLAIILIITSVSAFVWELRPKAKGGSGITSLTVMTYNIQQGVNITGDKNYDKQLALIEEVNPDIVGLQECDTARISGGNSDVVRYFANRLNFYSFYGPRTVTGTFGVAILSRYPIINTKSVFTYSDTDEIGTAEAQVKVGETIFNVYASHPDGSDAAKLAHIQALIARINGKTNVISMGDFNSRENSTYYNISVSVLQDVWLTKLSGGVDGPSFNLLERIDHIFVSHSFTVLETWYITDPQSDHPALWTEIQL